MAAPPTGPAREEEPEHRAMNGARLHVELLATRPPGREGGLEELVGPLSRHRRRHP
jgi:hypothetical protein